MKGFICAICGDEVTDPYRQVLETVAYMRKDFNKRERQKELRRLCKDCVPRALQQRIDQPLPEPTPPQGTLL